MCQSLDGLENLNWPSSTGETCTAADVDEIQVERLNRFPDGFARIIHRFGCCAAGLVRGNHIIAENRDRVTCLFRTQLPAQTGRFSLAFSAFEAQDLSAI